MRTSHNDIVFCFDFDRLTPDGLLYDYGPLGLHATPGAGGAAPTRQLDGSYYFVSTGAGSYFDILGDAKVRFYANAPTGTHTWAALFAQQTLETSALFATDNSGGGGVWKGGIFVTNTQGSILDYVLQGGAALPTITHTYKQLGPVIHAAVVTCETAPRAIDNCTTLTSSWTAGAYGATVYDSAITPRIGQRPSTAYKFSGRLYYLCLLRGAVSSSDMAELSAMMMNGAKPWCVR